MPLSFPSNAASSVLPAAFPVTAPPGVGGFSGAAPSGVRTISAVGPTVLAVTDSVIFVNAAANNVTIRLPAANSYGALESSDITVVRQDNSANVVTINGAPGDSFVDGSVTQNIAGFGTKRYTPNGTLLWSVG